MSQKNQESLNKKESELSEASELNEQKQTELSSSRKQLSNKEAAL